MKKSIFLFLISLCFASCQPESPRQKEKTVLVSIAPYAFFVHQIAGKDQPVTTLVPEGANPHIYEPKPKEVEKVRDASLWVRLGESFDQKVFKVIQEQNPQMRIVDVTEGIHLLSSCEVDDPSHEHHHCHGNDEGSDIHIWLSPKLAKVQADTIAKALMEAFPENSQLYEKNLNRFIAELDLLDQEISTILAPMKGDAILVSHPAFAYFCQDYGLVQLSVEMEGKEPLPQQVTHLLEEARHYKVATVILEPQYSNKGAELIAQELGIPTATVDPYAEDYLDNLRSIAQIIAKPLQAE
ncbi:MAG: zinc ABC transporter substrate-binding protein [Verrucomicrobia bacterium]|nr:zinc ABC transporter substrate-binding protein [Verrucomicrobiota bacterium]